MAEWNYNRIGENGRLYSYYGKCQKWEYTERDRLHTVQVNYVAVKPNGVQYYLISVDGKLEDSMISAARLHYFLNQKKAKEVHAGALMPLPLLIEEVQTYFEHNNWTDCPNCGGGGIDDGGKICRCAERLVYEIKNFNAEKRLADIIKRVEA